MERWVGWIYNCYILHTSILRVQRIAGYRDVEQIIIQTRHACTTARPRRDWGLRRTRRGGRQGKAVGRSGMNGRGRLMGGREREARAQLGSAFPA